MPPSDDLAALWRNRDVDANFNAGLRLYEPRAWAMQELNVELFRRHVERGEVAFQRHESGLAIGIIVREQLPSEDFGPALRSRRRGNGDGGGAG